jgi:methionyl-tRNA formyltransferase
MLPEIVWSMPPLGTINLHASLLPQYRGAAPINWAIVNGEKTTGVTTFFIEKEIDTGMVLAKQEINIAENMTAGELHDELLEIGKKLITKSVEMIETSNFTKIPQANLVEGELKNAPKIFKEDCKINWNQPAGVIHNFIRGFSPYPTAWTIFEFEDKNYEKTIKIFKSTKTDQPVLNNSQDIIVTKSQVLIPCADFYLQIDELQVEGKKKMIAKDFISGYKTEKIKFI